MTSPHLPLVDRRRIDAVVFDMDDTLYDERDYVRSGYAAVADHLATDNAAARAMAAWMWQRFLGGHTGNMFNALARQFNLALGDSDIKRLVEIYRIHRPALVPHPKAVELLDALDGRVRLGLLSDGFLPAQRYKLEALGLSDRFDAVLFTETLGRECWKPSPIGFERIAAELEVKHERCVYVGDNPAKDFVAPNALGWLSIQWKRPGQIHAAKTPPPGGQAQRLICEAGQLLRLIV